MSTPPIIEPAPATSRRTSIVMFLVTLVVVFLLWNTPVMYPLKILVVFFHEASHALMTLFTGGAVEEMALDPRQGGHVLSRGGNRFLILFAGYLGSLVWGSTIYLLAMRTKWDRALMCGLGGLMILVAILFVRNGFGLAFSLLTGAVMLLMGWKLHAGINEFILGLIGMTSMIYVPLDIYSDTISRSHLRSDAYMLAEEYGGFTMLWGGLWMVISIVVVVWTVKKSLVREEVGDSPLSRTLS